MKVQPVSTTHCCWRPIPDYAMGWSWRNSRSALDPHLLPDLPAKLLIGRAGHYRVTLPVVWPNAHPRTRAFLQLPDAHAQFFPRLCYRAEDKDTGMYMPLMASIRLWRRQWTVWSFTRTLISVVPHFLSMRWWEQLPLRWTKQSVWMRENPLGSYWMCRIVCRN